MAEVVTEQYCTVIPAPVKSLEEWIKSNVYPGDPKNGNKSHRSAPCRYGCPDVPEPFKPSYRGIEIENMINDPDNYEIRHKVEISSDLNVIFNGALIAESPKQKCGKSKKIINRNQAEKLRFCHAVIWSLMNDQENLKDHIARCPALEINQIKDEVPDEVPAIIATPEVVSVPVIQAPSEDLGLYEPTKDDLIEIKITQDQITGYPVIIEMNCDEINYEVDLERLESDLREAFFEDDNSEYDTLEYDQPMIAEVYSLINPVSIAPVIIRQWSYKNIIIQEVPA